MATTTQIVNPAELAGHLEVSDMSRRRYQKGSLQQQNGNWTGRYLEYYINEQGQQKFRQRRVYLGPVDKMTEKMAWRTFQPFVDQANQTSAQPKHLITLNQFLQRWEPLGMPKTETARNFRSALNKYIKPTFGDKQLSDIQTEALQRFVSQTSTGASNVHNILKCFRAIWKSAKAWGYVKHNPFEDLILPTIEKDEQRFLTLKELCLILTSAAEPFKTLYWILAQTGLRIGEVLALTWESVDLATGVIYIHGSVARGRLRDNKTKTKAAKRIIPISPKLLEHLHKYRAITTTNPDNLLFANPEQKPYNADKLLEREFQPFLVKLGIPKAGFHAFRHASATILSQMKVPMEIRRQRMGHVNEEMTLRYTHVIEDAAKDVAAEFDKMLLPEVTLDMPEDNLKMLRAHIWPCLLTAE